MLFAALGQPRENLDFHSDKADFSLMRKLITASLALTLALTARPVTRAGRRRRTASSATISSRAPPRPRLQPVTGSRARRPKHRTNGSAATSERKSRLRRRADPSHIVRRRANRRSRSAKSFQGDSGSFLFPTATSAFDLDRPQLPFVLDGDGQLRRDFERHRRVTLMTRAAPDEKSDAPPVRAESFVASGCLDCVVRRAILLDQRVTQRLVRAARVG